MNSYMLQHYFCECTFCSMLWNCIFYHYHEYIFRFLNIFTTILCCDFMIVAKKVFIYYDAYILSLFCIFYQLCCNFMKFIIAAEYIAAVNVYFTKLTMNSHVLPHCCKFIYFCHHTVSIHYSISPPKYLFMYNTFFIT